MKKRLIVTYFLFWMLIFVPAVSYAWLSFVAGAAQALVATKAGQMLIKHGSRFAITKIPKDKLVQGALATYAMCQSYNDFTGDTCGEYVKRLHDAVTGDGWTVASNAEGTGVDIYKLKPGCMYKNNKNSDLLYDTFDEACYAYRPAYNKYWTFDSVWIDKDSLGNTVCKSKKISNINGSIVINAIGIYEVCDVEKVRQPISNDDVWDLIQDPDSGITGDDIAQIYNYDYSDKSIVINNHTYNGDDIAYNFEPSVNIDHPGDGTDGLPGWGLDIDPTFAPKLVPILLKPELDIGLPDINYNNCTANAQGAIVNCDKLERKYNIDIDGDGKIGNEDPTCPDSYTLKDDKCVKVDPKPPSDEPKDPKDPKDPQPLVEQKPWLCTTSEFTRKVCDWIDWTQKDYGSDNDTKIQVTDLTKQLPQIDTNRIKFNGQCPPAETQNIRLMGASVNIKIKYDHYCEFMIKFKPFAIGLASISAVLIITRRA